MRETDYDKWLYKNFHGGFSELCPRMDWPNDNYSSEAGGDNSVECATQWIIEQHLPELLKQPKITIIIGD